MKHPSEPERQQSRRFGWSDMLVAPDADPRTEGRYSGERETSPTCSITARGWP